MTHFLELSTKLKAHYVYVAHTDYVQALCEELGQVTAIFGQLVFSKKQKNAYFAQDIWCNPVLISVDSINQAAKHLQQRGRFWFTHKVACIRRAELILEKLRSYPLKNITFPLKDSLPEIGGFSLLDQNTLIYSAKRWKRLPDGRYPFLEDKITPPNRAYLKLWEAFSFLEHYPTKEQLAIDLGASPGGWTYVLQQLGARVIAVDKAALAEKIATLPRVSVLQQSAFALDLNDFPRVHWLVCDVACYPERLSVLLKKWIDSQKVENIIATIKLQGETDFALLDQIQTELGGEILHLSHNKHELTFLYPAKKREAFSPMIIL